MVEFVTLLFGLMTGIRNIEVNVAGPVAQVELRLDGETIATLSEEPWRIDYDFGSRLLPHELVAIARDDRGRELDRTVQWVNLAQPLAEAKIAFETDESGKPLAVRLSWETIGQLEPERIEVRFDGTLLTVEDPSHIPLPEYELDQRHFVSATVQFSDRTTKHLDASFGGSYAEEFSSALTAVAIRLEKPGGLPSLARMGSWFAENGRPIAIHGVDKEIPEVIVVREPAVQSALDRMAVAVHRRGVDPNRGPGSEAQQWDPPRFFPADAPPPSRVDWDRLTGIRTFAAFSKPTFLRFFSPVAATIFPTGVHPEMFPYSTPFSGEEGGFSWLVQKQRPLSLPVQKADAVAVAGMVAQAGGRRRAVILLASGERFDDSHHSWSVVRDYLAVLQVPFRVWVIGDSNACSAWAEAVCLGDSSEPLRAARGLERAVEQLERDLSRQRVVWLKGRHLPQEIQLTPAARGVLLAGSTGRS